MKMALVRNPNLDTYQKLLNSFPNILRHVILSFVLVNPPRSFREAHLARIMTFVLHLFLMIPACKGLKSTTSSRFTTDVASHLLYLDDQHTHHSSHRFAGLARPWPTVSCRPISVAMCLLVQRSNNEAILPRKKHMHALIHLRYRRSCTMTSADINDRDRCQPHHSQLHQQFSIIAVCVFCRHPLRLSRPPLP